MRNRKLSIVLSLEIPMLLVIYCIFSSWLYLFAQNSLASHTLPANCDLANIYWAGMGDFTGDKWVTLRNLPMTGSYFPNSLTLGNFIYEFWSWYLVLQTLLCLPWVNSLMYIYPGRFQSAVYNPKWHSLLSLRLRKTAETEMKVDIAYYPSRSWPSMYTQYIYIKYAQ